MSLSSAPVGRSHLPQGDGKPSQSSLRDASSPEGGAFCHSGEVSCLSAKLLAREYPFRLAATRQATFPKGTALAAAIKFPAQPKGVPLGELAANAVSRLRGLASPWGSWRVAPEGVSAETPPVCCADSPLGDGAFGMAGEFLAKAQSFRERQRLPLRGSWQNRQVLTEGVKFFFLNVSFCIFFALRYKVSRTFLIFHRNVMTFFVKSGILYLAGTVGPQPLPRT